MMTFIEFYLAVMVSVILLPWGVLQPTSFFAEFSIGWIMGGLVRVLITAALVGLAVPMITNLKLNPSSGGDPTLYSAVLLSLASGVLAIISWVVPARAAAIAGRGVSLALHGGTILAGAAGTGRVALAGRGRVPGRMAAHRAGLPGNPAPRCQRRAADLAGRTPCHGAPGAPRRDPRRRRLAVHACPHGPGLCASRPGG